MDDGGKHVHGGVHNNGVMEDWKRRQERCMRVSDMQICSIQVSSSSHSAVESGPPILTQALPVSGAPISDWTWLNPSRGQQRQMRQSSPAVLNRSPSMKTGKSKEGRWRRINKTQKSHHQADRHRVRSIQPTTAIEVE